MKLSVDSRYFRILQPVAGSFGKCESSRGISTSKISYEVNPVKPSSNVGQKARDATRSDQQPPNRDSKNNWVAPPHETSNLRLTHFYVPENEMRAIKQFREKMEEIQEWNQAYWEKHNSNFLKLKEEFICNKLKEINTKGEKRQTLTADEMAVFYKKFLNDNHKRHMAYNSEWYRKYIRLVWYSAKASIAQVYQNLKNRF